MAPGVRESRSRSRCSGTLRHSFILSPVGFRSFLSLCYNRTSTTGISPVSVHFAHRDHLLTRNPRSQAPDTAAAHCRAPARRRWRGTEDTLTPLRNATDSSPWLACDGWLNGWQEIDGCVLSACSQGMQPIDPAGGETAGSLVCFQCCLHFAIPAQDCD